MNSWLDTLVPAARVCNPAWRDGGKAACHFPDPWRWPEACYGRMLFHWSDAVHDHAPIRAYAPPGTFCFTMLREPGQRLVSQFADWRQLSEEHLAVYDDAMRACLLDSREMGLTAFLARYGAGLVRPSVDNHLTRALAASLRGEHVLSSCDAASLLDDALHALHHDFDFIGLAEAFDVSRNALCALLGLPPCGTAPRRNARRTDAEPTELLTLSEQDKWRYTRFDQIVYQAACRLFESRFRALGETYDSEQFERQHATGLLRQSRAVYCAGAAKYSVSEPFYGAGLHQRDGSQPGHNAVWTVSGGRAALYIPAPIGMPVELLLWVRGYAAEPQREMLRIWVDGRAVQPAFAPADGYREILVLPHLPAAEFARLELDVPHCAPDCPEDTRPRGICFDAYGWRPMPPDAMAAAPQAYGDRFGPVAGTARTGAARTGAACTGVMNEVLT